MDIDNYRGFDCWWLGWEIQLNVDWGGHLSLGQLKCHDVIKDELDQL